MLKLKINLKKEAQLLVGGAHVGHGGSLKLVHGGLGGSFEAAKHPRGHGGKFAPKPGSGKTSGVKLEDKIHIQAGSNPKKAGSKSAERFALYKNGQTVGEYQQALVVAGHDKKSALADVAWDIKHGHVTVHAPDEYVAAVGQGKHPPAVKPAREKSAQVTAKPAEPVDASDWTKVGSKMGSNEGGTYQAPDGKKYYVKQQQSADHLHNELLANDLYHAVGVRTLNPVAGVMNGKPVIITELKQVGKFNQHSPSMRQEAQEAFAAHAFVANWDSVGQVYDNQGYVDGKIATLDAGGSLRYRAQGGLKPKFDGDVTEFDTLRNGTNAQTAKVFGEMTSDQIEKSAAPVLKLTDEKIDQIVARNVPNKAEAKKYADVLKKRRDDIAARVKAEHGKNAAELAELKSQAGAHAYELKSAVDEAVKKGVPSETPAIQDAHVVVSDSSPTADSKQALKSKILTFAYYKQNVAEAVAEHEAALYAKQSADMLDKDPRWSKAAGARDLSKVDSYTSGYGTANAEAKAVVKKTWDDSGLTYVSNSQSAAINSYTGSGYGPINGALRAEAKTGPITQKHIDEIDNLMRKSSFAKDTILYRGYGPSATTINKSPPPDIIRDAGYTSSSINPRIAVGFSDNKTVFRVRVPKGFPGIGIANSGSGPWSVDGESEMLLPRGTSYKVLGRVKKAFNRNGTWWDVVDVEAVHE